MLNTPFARWLDRNKITVRALSKITDYSYATCKAWRTGDRNPSRGAREILSIRLKVSKATIKRLFP